MDLDTEGLGSNPDPLFGAARPRATYCTSPSFSDSSTRECREDYGAQCPAPWCRPRGFSGQQKAAGVSARRLDPLSSVSDTQTTICDPRTARHTRGPPRSVLKGHSCQTSREGDVTSQPCARAGTPAAAVALCQHGWSIEPLPRAR